MSYTRTKSANFGKGRAGLATVGYTLYNADGTVNTARSTAGVVERPSGSGIYLAPIAFPPGFQGLLAWDTGGLTPAYAADEVNPGTDEFLDAAVSSLAPSSVGAATAPVPTAAAWAALAQVYCTDEDIALRALGDYTVLCPDSQSLAYGADGVFGSANRWKLTSATVDFNASGVHAGNVLWLTQPRSTYGNDGALLAVDSVAADGSATLRRLGKAAGAGQPPAPAGGLAGVEFTVLTFDPQIDEASFEINQWYNIDLTQDPTVLYNPRQLRQSAVLWVLQRAYGLKLTTQGTAFALKLARIDQELAELRERVIVQRGPRGDTESPVGPVGARVRR